MKKLSDLTLEEVQIELEKRGLSVAGEDAELGQLITELSRQVILFDLLDFYDRIILSHKIIIY